MATVAPTGSWEAVKRKAKYGHRDWIICYWRSGERVAWPLDKDSIGCARLCINEGGKAFMCHKNSGIFANLNLAILEIMHRNAERGWL